MINNDNNKICRDDGGGSLGRQRWPGVTGQKEAKKEKEKEEKEEKKKEEKFLHTDGRTGGSIKGSTRPKNKIQFKFSALCETPSHICF